ncbi:hypothetical protein ACOMHN_066277 [Nucella lapillus]
MLSRELLLSSPKNTFAHSAGFFEELLIQRDMELSLLPYQPYLVRLLKQRGLNLQDKPEPRTEPPAQQTQPGQRQAQPGPCPSIKCVRCGGSVCTESAAPTPAPGAATTPTFPASPVGSLKGPDFAIFGSATPSQAAPVQSNSKRCAHCGGLVTMCPPKSPVTPPAQTPQPQTRQPQTPQPQTPQRRLSTASQKGPDFAFFGTNTAGAPRSNVCTPNTCDHVRCVRCGCDLEEGEKREATSRVEPKVDEEFPKYQIIPLPYEKDSWGRLMTSGRQKDSDEIDLINTRSLSTLMDY